MKTSKILSKQIVKSFLLTGLFLVFGLIHVQAQTNTWIGPASGDWAIAANWDLGVVPTASHDVIIPAGSGTVKINTVTVAQSVKVNANCTLRIFPGAELIVNGAGSTPIGISIWANGILMNSGLIEVSNSTIGIDNLGTFHNDGLLFVVETDTGIGNLGLAVFENHYGGFIEVLLHDEGLNNTGSFVNWGSLYIHSGTGNGIKNNSGGEITNKADGLITIETVQMTGIFQYFGNSHFQNDGQLLIQEFVGMNGIFNTSATSFSNGSTGTIHVSSHQGTGIIVSSGSELVNGGSIFVDGLYQSRSVTNAGVLRNLSCSTLECYEFFENGSGGDFRNQGLFITHVQNNVNLGTVLNRGIMNELAGPSWLQPIINQQVILNPLSSGGNAPVSPALFGSNISFPVVNNEFYLDAGQTSVYGTYDPVSNTLTPIDPSNPMPPAAITLYATMEDPQSACSFEVEIPLTVTTCPVYYLDADEDGFGDKYGEGTEFCPPTGPPPGYVTDNSDCNDADNTVYPGAPELCDGILNDCDGVEPPVQVWYVDIDADPGIQDGLNWGTAFVDLQLALDAASDNGGACNQIWVAEGVYAPTEFVDWGVQGPNGAHKSFHSRQEMQIYGGFTGVENDLNGRNWENNVTILTGDRGMGTNAFHVMRIKDVDNSFLLDGFTIQEGESINGPSFPESDLGGGIWVESGSPQFRNCTIQLNKAVLGGGAYIQSGSPGFVNCTFSMNDADQAGFVINQGGAVYVETGNPEFDQCIFINNTAQLGGGVFLNKGNPVFNSCWFEANDALIEGGGFRINQSNPVLTNCVLNNNTAERDGAAIHNRKGNPLFNHCTFYGNKTDQGTPGDVVLNYRGFPEIENSVIWGNGGGGNHIIEDVDPMVNTSITNTVMQFGCTPDLQGCDGNTVLDADPMFVDPGMGDFHLQAGSPALNHAIGSLVDKDYAGNDRPLGGMYPDAGAFEGFEGFDNCLDFDGVNDFVHVPDQPDPW
jgi:hypothetical protein